MERISPVGMSRRAVMAAGLAALAAGCSYGFDPNADDSAPPPDDDSGQDPAGQGSDGQESENAPPENNDDQNDEDDNGDDENVGASALTSKGDVPVGGGVIFENEEVVITQPAEGDFRAFSAVCTHQGCPVESIEGDEILCSLTCGHGSKFNLADGSVTSGPAPQPLTEVQLSIDGDNINLA